MKRLFLMLFAALALAACDKGGDDAPGEIKLTEGTQTSQTVYADETGKSEGIKFKAAADWTATVGEVAKAGDKTMWLRLSAYEGKAGDVSLSFELDPNYTDKDRKAEIRITCSGTTVTITIEQKATTASGEKPEPGQPAGDVRLVSKIIYTCNDEKEGDVEVTTFSYDAKNRMVAAKIIYEDHPETELSLKYTWAYNGSTITYKEVVTDGDPATSDTYYTYTETATITLNADGTVKTRDSKTVNKRNNEVSGTYEDHNTMTYVNGYLASVYYEGKSDYGERDKGTNLFTWDDKGNMVGIYDESEYSSSYEYLAAPYSKKCNIDLAAYMDMELSVMTLNLGTRTASLCSKMTEFYTTSSSDEQGNVTVNTGEDVYHYAYEYDAKGYVTKITVTEPNRGWNEPEPEVPEAFRSASAALKAPLKSNRLRVKSNLSRPATRSSSDRISVYTIEYKD